MKADERFRECPMWWPLAWRVFLVSFAWNSLASAECEGYEKPGIDGESERVVASYLAVGDFGKPPGWIPFLDPRQSVAEALDTAHRCRPADGLLLLGDNVYPSGLTEDNFSVRVADTIIGPFCRFLSMKGIANPNYERACEIPTAERKPVPIVAVMGNHDYGSLHSERLEKEELPRLFPEWRLPSGLVEVYESPGGVSLIAIDSVKLHEGAEFEPLVAALKRSQGPWRILMAHHPMTVGGRPWETRYTEGIEQAIERSGQRVHLILAGHEHHLALASTGNRKIPLQVVSGSGSRIRGASHQLLGKTRRWLALGFLRLDLIESGGSVERLRLRVQSTRRMPGAFWMDSETLEELWVSTKGELTWKNGFRLDPDS